MATVFVADAATGKVWSEDIFEAIADFMGRRKLMYDRPNIERLRDLREQKDENGALSLLYKTELICNDLALLNYIGSIEAELKRLAADLSAQQRIAEQMLATQGQPNDAN